MGFLATQTLPRCLGALPILHLSRGSALFLQIPSESGVFGLLAGDASRPADSRILESQARLLDLINTLNVPLEVTVVYELCPESEAATRCHELQAELMVSVETAVRGDHLPGISFWSGSGPLIETPVEGREI